MNDCSICLTSEIIQTEKCITNCEHAFCKPCLDGWFNTGKFTCPLCIQPINYFKNNDINYRLIKINTNFNDNQYFMIDKKIINIFRYISVIIIIGFIFQAYLIYYLYNKNNSLKAMYSKENQKLVNIINDNNYNNLNDKLEVSIYNPTLLEYITCWIPTYYINKCFN